MATLDIQGIPVEFPFKPYDCQLTYMEGVLRALEKATNALLESPTGTGKTLCLLCSTLAWQRRNATMVQNSRVKELAYEPAATDLSKPPPEKTQQQLKQIAGQATSSPSVIIYSSRTHSQLSQVANELKNTVYRPRLSLLGSRDQLCVHEEATLPGKWSQELLDSLSKFPVSQMKGPAKNHACQALVGARRCKYHRGTEGMELAGPASGGNGVGGNGGGSGGQSDLTTVPDIEELVSLARTREFCPYYLGRGQAPRAELVLMPYNYLLDPATRRGIKLNWANSVVIFDEAHNLENVASEAASFELTSAQVAGAQEEALRCHKILTEGGSGGIFDQDKGGAQADDALLVKQALHHLEDAVEGVDLPTGSQGVTRAGEFVYALFGHAGINFDTVKLWLGKLEEMSDTLQENAPFGHAAALKLDCVARAIKVAFRGGHATKQDCLSFAEMYRTHVAPAERTMAPEENGDGRVGRGRGGNRGAGGGAGSAGRVLCFWCFCPGVAMEDLRSLGVRSILVTSGTLSPMSSFANELRLPFEVQVENPHVIGPEQAWIGTLGRGVTNVTLNSSYSNRDNDLYKDELGMTLANLCRIVPGGVLVFFSTYRIMNDCVLRWKHHEGGRTWTRISAHKEPMMEPRTAADLKAWGVMEEFDSKIANTGGAVFLAVCRGKVSEGMDFSDSRARCVVITGIPYAPAMDAKVILKKKYMSESLLPPGVPRLSGQEWYQQQASRAVNQAIGRVIRHRFDYGCVVLCDQRFSEERNRKNLSLWARPFVRECAGFGRVAADLTRFFKACAANPGLKHTDRSGQSKTPMGPAVPRSNPTSIPGAHPPVRPFTARLRNLTGVGSIAGGGREDAPRSGDSGVDLGGNTSGLQDVGDIVESIGVGRASGAAGSQENSQDGGNHRPGTRSFGLDRKAGVGGTATRVTGAAGTAPSVAAAPMGLLDALRASANAKASAAETMASTDGAKSGAGAGEAADKSGRGDGIGGTWESIPLSQRLAAVGKSAGGVPGSGWRTTAANQKQKHQRDPNKNRSRGVGEHQQGAGSALETRGGAQDVSGVRPRQDRRGGEENARRDGASGKSTALGEPAEIHRDNPTKGSSLGGTSRCSTESETDSRVPSASRDDQKSGVASSGGSSGAGRGEEGGAKAEKKGGSRRQELASLLSDLKSSVSPGAFDVFRSRARAMKEPGVLDTAETALPALRGVLEVLMLAPPELMLPRRFTPHVPEQHGEGYAALLAKHVSPPEGAAAVRKAPRPGRESGAGRGDPAHARARAIPEHSRGSGAQDGEGRRTAGGKRRGPGDGIGNTPGRNAMDRAAKEHVGSQARQTSAVRGAEDRRNTAHDCGAPPRGRGDKVDPGAIAVRGGTPARSKASKSASSAGLSTPGVPPRSKPGLASNPDDGDEGSEDATGGTSKRARLMAAGAGERSHRGGSGSANVKGVCAARGGGTGGAGTKPSPVSRLLEMASSGRKEKKLESNARPRTTDRR